MKVISLIAARLREIPEDHYVTEVMLTFHLAKKLITESIDVGCAVRHDKGNKFYVDFKTGSVWFRVVPGCRNKFVIKTRRIKGECATNG